MIKAVLTETACIKLPTLPRYAPGDRQGVGQLNDGLIVDIASHYLVNHQFVPDRKHLHRVNGLLRSNLTSFLECFVNWSPFGLSYVARISVQLEFRATNRLFLLTSFLVTGWPLMRPAWQLRCLKSLQTVESCLVVLQHLDFLFWVRVSNVLFKIELDFLGTQRSVVITVFIDAWFSHSL